MGHLGHLKTEYQSLITRLDAGLVGMPEPVDEKAKVGWRRVLEILFTPEEAALAAQMPVRPGNVFHLWVASAAMRSCGGIIP